MTTRQYQVTTGAARVRGAIGAFYPVTEGVRAQSPREALAAFRVRYETAGPPVIVVDDDADSPELGRAWRSTEFEGGER